MAAVEGFDPRLQLPFSALIAGPSNSGRTCFVKSILENSEHVLSCIISETYIIYCVVLFMLYTFVR
jgi:septin family protein